MPNSYQRVGVKTSTSDIVSQSGMDVFLEMRGMGKKVG